MNQAHQVVVLFAGIVFLASCAFHTGWNGEWKATAGGEKNHLKIIQCGDEIIPSTARLGMTRIYLQSGNINHGDLLDAPEDFREWFGENRVRLGKCVLIETDSLPAMGESEALVGFSRILIENRYPFGREINIDGQTYVSDEDECYKAEGKVLVIKNRMTYELPFRFQNTRDEFTRNVHHWLDSLCRP